MLQSAQVTAGATAMSLSITGGSAITLSKAKTLTNGSEYVVSADTDSRTRRRVKASTTTASPNAGMASGYTMDKGTIEIIVPKTLANTKMDYPKVSISYNFSVENSAAEKSELRRLAAQAILDSDFDDFWSFGSTN